MQWKELDVINGSYKTVYNRFRLWSNLSIFKDAYKIILKKYVTLLNIDTIKYFATDTSFIKSIGGGYPSVPRKRFLRYLAASGVVIILDEFNTSKCCPGCHSVLEETDKKRVRRCKSDQSVNCLLTSENGSNFEEDRDIIATINMAICAHDLLLTGKRPEYLSRIKYKNGTVEHEQEKLINECTCLN